MTERHSKHTSVQMSYTQNRTRVWACTGLGALGSWGVKGDSTSSQWMWGLCLSFQSGHYWFEKSTKSDTLLLIFIREIVLQNGRCICSMHNIRIGQRISLFLYGLSDETRGSFQLLIHACSQVCEPLGFQLKHDTQTEFKSISSKTPYLPSSHKQGRQVLSQHPSWRVSACVSIVSTHAPHKAMSKQSCLLIIPLS